MINNYIERILLLTAIIFFILGCHKSDSKFDPQIATRLLNVEPISMTERAAVYLVELENLSSDTLFLPMGINGLMYGQANIVECQTGESSLQFRDFIPWYYYPVYPEMSFIVPISARKSSKLSIQLSDSLDRRITIEFETNCKFREY